MTASAVAEQQASWNCRWGRPRHGFVQVAGKLRESHRVCTREAEPRQVLDEECRTCSYWDMAAYERPAFAGVSAYVTVPEAAVTVPQSFERLQDRATRAVLVLMAVALFAVGFTQLTTILAVPFVIALWLGATALLGVVAFASLDGIAPPYADSCEHGGPVRG